MRRRRLVVGIALLSVFAAATLASPDAAFSILSWLAADPLRFGVALLALALVRPLVAWPTTLLAVAVGFGYGVAGVPIALALIVLTSIPPFLFARHVGGTNRVSAAGERFVDATGDVRAVTASRLVPAPSDVVSVGAGVSGVSLPAFVVGTALGEIPWALAGTLAGASAESLAAGTLADAFDLRVVLAGVIVAAMLLARPAYRYLSGKRAEPAA